MEDISNACRTFLQVYAGKYNKSALHFAARLLSIAQLSLARKCSELQNVIERQFLLSKGDKIDNLNIQQGEGEPAASTSFAAFAAPGVSTGFSERRPVLQVAPAPLSFEALGSGTEVFERVGKLVVDSLKEREEGNDLPDVFDSIEGGIVRAVLKRTRGNKQAAAQLLGVYRPRLYGMIKRHKISEDE